MSVLRCPSLKQIKKNKKVYIPPWTSLTPVTGPSGHPSHSSYGRVWMRAFVQPAPWQPYINYRRRTFGWLAQLFRAASADAETHVHPGSAHVAILAIAPGPGSADAG